jgi:hypothetical protein
MRSVRDSPPELRGELNGAALRTAVHLTVGNDFGSYELVQSAGRFPPMQIRRKKPQPVGWGLSGSDRGVGHCFAPVRLAERAGGALAAIHELVHAKGGL